MELCSASYRGNLRTVIIAMLQQGIRTPDSRDVKRAVERYTVILIIAVIYMQVAPLYYLHIVIYVIPILSCCCVGSPVTSLLDSRFSFNFSRPLALMWFGQGSDEALIRPTSRTLVD